MKALSLAFAAVIVLVGLCGDAIAQGRLYAKGTNAFLVGVNASKAGDVSTIGAGVGFTLGGTFDFGLAYDQSTTDDEDVGDMTGKGFTPSVVLHAIKESEDVPVSCSFVASYTKMSFSADILDAYGLEATGSGFGLQVMLHRTFWTQTGVHIIPSAALSYADVEVEVTDGTDSVTEGDTATNVVLAVTAAMDAGEGNLLVATPAITLGDGDTAISLSLGFAVPLQGY